MKDVRQIMKWVGEKDKKRKRQREEWQEGGRKTTIIFEYLSLNK